MNFRVSHYGAVLQDAIATGKLDGTDWGLFREGMMGMFVLK